MTLTRHVDQRGECRSRDSILRILNVATDDNATLRERDREQRKGKETSQLGHCFEGG